MESTLLGSSLSSRSRATTEQSSSVIGPSVSPRLSFRHRRRTKDTFHRHDPPSRAAEPLVIPHSVKPWHRIRTRLSGMDDLSHLPPTAASCISAQQQQQQHHQQHSEITEIAPASDLSETAPSTTNTSPASSANHTDLHPSRATRLLTNTTQTPKSIRTLMPPPRSPLLENHCASLNEFLRAVSVPSSVAPESTDTSFKAHSHLLRKITLDPFDLNRYLFAHKPIAKVQAVLATVLLSVPDIDQKSFPMTPALRTAIMYVSGNAHRNVYVMTYAAQLKTISRSRPAADGILPQMILEGQYLSETEIAALDFAQELSSVNAAVHEPTRRRLLDANPESDGRLERLVTGTAAYGAFLSTLTGTIDLELTHASIQYASNNLQGLPWKSSGAPVNVGFLDDEMGDFGSTAPSGFGSKYRPKRERLSLTRNYERHNRDRSGSGRPRPRGIRRVSHFFTSSLMGPKTITDVNKVTEVWMKQAGVPPLGQLFDINDEIYSLFGFHPYYFSTVAMEGEASRRAFLFGAKELLFAEKHVTRRLKFIICYVLSSGKERRRILDSDHSRSFEKQGVHNGHSITSVYSQRTYDSLSIMSAHSAFLASKYGASPAELVAASDVSRVRSAMEQYSDGHTGNLTSKSIGFPLTQRDCAAVIIAHSLLRDSPFIEQSDLTAFEITFGATGKGPDQGNRYSRVALMEIIGAASMWSAFERFATGALAFDIDCTSNMVFGTGRAEPVISEFCRSNEGRKIGLSLATNESRDVSRVRSDSRASRTSSLRPSMSSSKRLYRKRTSSALNSSSRVGRMFGSGGKDEMQLEQAVVS